MIIFFSSLLKSSIFAFRVMNHDAIQWWDFKKNVFVQIVNCAFPCPWHVWGAILMNTFCSIQYALWLSSSKASRALTCQKSHLLPWLQNEQYYFAPHIHSASFLLLLPWTVPSSALSPGPSLISQGGAVWKRGLLVNREIPEQAGVSQDHNKTNNVLSFGRNL